MTSIIANSANWIFFHFSIRICMFHKIFVKWSAITAANFDLFVKESIVLFLPVINKMSIIKCVVKRNVQLHRCCVAEEINCIDITGVYWDQFRLPWIPKMACSMKSRRIFFFWLLFSFFFFVDWPNKIFVITIGSVHLLPGQLLLVNRYCQLNAGSVCRFTTVACNQQHCLCYRNIITFRWLQSLLCHIHSSS